MRKVIIVNGILKCQATAIRGFEWRDYFIDIDRVVSISQSQDENESEIHLINGYSLIVNMDLDTISEVWTNHKNTSK